MEEENTEYLKLSVEERCVHKLWKARVSGYEEATKLFRQWDEKSAEFTKFLPLVRKFPKEANVLVQEKALEATLSFVENSGFAGKVVSDVMSGVVEKCLGSAKQKTKDMAAEVTLMCVEVEKYEVVQEELLKGFSAKNPKVVSGCVSTLTRVLHDFGTKVINMKVVVKQISPLLEARDKSVREEGKKLTVELYRWIGSALTPLLSALKPVQLTELEAEFGKVSAEKPVPVRFIKSEQEMKVKAASVGEENDEDAGGENEEAEPAFNPLDLVNPVDILSKLPKDFYEKLDAKKWQERKESLETLQELVKHPKLESGDYSELVKALKKIISKDSNVIVVALGATCLASLVTGLQRKFQPYAVSCIPVLLEKFKEKKLNVVTALKSALDAIYPTTTIEAIQEEVIVALAHKTPSVKSETAHFLSRSLCKTQPTAINKKLLKAYTTALIKNLADSDPNVRDAAAETLGTAQKLLGEKMMAPFISELDGLKVQKVNEYCEKAVITVKVLKGGKPKTAKASVVKPVANSVQKPVAITSSSAPTERSTGVSRKPKQMAGKLTGSGPPGVKMSNKKELSFPTEKELSEEEVDNIASEILSAEILSGVVDANWKVRLASIEQLQEHVSNMDKSNIPTQCVVRLLTRKPGLKDNNVQVLRPKLKCLQYLAENGTFTTTTVQCCLTDVVDKLGDIKTVAPAAETLTAITEATKLSYITNEMMSHAFTQKNPRVQAECMNWLGKSIKDFGFSIQPKPVITDIKKALSASNPQVRSSSISLLGVLYLYMGATVRMFFEDEKPAVLQQIDTEFEKYIGQKPPPPSRGLSKSSADPTGEEHAKSEDAAVQDAQDLIPRTDISAQITSDLIAQLGDKNWKIRNESLSKVQGIINDAKFISGNLGELPMALSARLVDTNKNLSLEAMNICQQLGVALGPHCKQHIRIFGPNMMQALSDNKSNVRMTALGCLNTWFDQTCLNDFCEGEMFADALKGPNPYLKSELLSWLIDKLPTVKSLPKDELTACLPHLYNAVEDRNADVRKAAQDAILPFMIHLGFEAMSKATSRLKPGSKAQVTSLLEKARPNLPAKPAAKQPAKPRLGNKTASKNGESPPNKTATVAAVKKPSVGRKVPAGKPVTKRKEEEVDTSPLLQQNNLKNNRIMDEQKLRILKWNFTSPREEFTEQLHDQMTAANINRTLVANMFHSDFKFHLKAIEALSEDRFSNLPALMSNLDLILKWMTLRFFDTNSSVLLKSLEYLMNVFSALAEEDYHLLDAEANSFIPYLVQKIGDPKEPVRTSVKNILKRLHTIYPSQKCFTFVIEGLKSKNARQRAECLDELGYLIETYGVEICQPSPGAALKEIARQIADRDNNVRNGALNAVTQAYFIIGEKVYRLIGQISDKDMSLLEERIKRASKHRSSHQVPEIKPQPVPATTRPPRPQSYHRDTDTKHNSTFEIQVAKRNVSPDKKQSRPHSGIVLDYKLLENMLEEGSSDRVTSQRNLVDIDLDTIINDAPVRLPETRMRPPSPAARVIANSSDVSQALDSAIAQIANPDSGVSVGALAQMDELLRSEEKVDVLNNRVDQLLVSVTMQYRLACNTHMANPEKDGEEVIKIYRNLTNVLLSLYKVEMLAVQASKDTLHDLINILISILLDPRLLDLPDSTLMIRSLNILVVRIVEKSDHTSIMSALIKLLHDCVGTNRSTKFTELVMKCLWKVIRLLADWVDKLDLSVIMLDIHNFLRVFPSAHWRQQRTDDTPIRTIKTIIHTLAKLRGNKIMSHLEKIENLQESELEKYLHRVLKSGLVKPESSDETHRKDIKSAKLPKSTQDSLAEILKKIGSKENTKEGLRQLHYFKKQNPSVDIEPYLKKSSQYFQHYIQRGLQSIENEEKTEQKDSCSQSVGDATKPPGVGLGTSDLNDAPPSVFLERLRILKQKAGIENFSGDTAPSSVKMERVGSFEAHEQENHQPHAASQIPKSESSGSLSSQVPENVDEIRRRLEQIKNTTR